MSDLNLTVAIAYTVHSSDSEVRSSDKGVYKDISIANKMAIGSGWWGSNGEVKLLENIFEDEKGRLYQVKFLGYPTNEDEEHKKNLLESIKSKLTDEELNFINKNKIV